MVLNVLLSVAHAAVEAPATDRDSIAKRNGSPVPCRARLPIRFILTRTR